MAKKLLKATTNAEILSYFINQNPEIASEIDLPVQGKSTANIGKLIMQNERFKNMFINTVNLIGLTIIKENRWQNPWDNFTNKGKLDFGQQIREIIQDLAKIHDFNENYSNKEKFLETEVPDVYNYMHQLNFQKYYETTINENELRMAFDNEETGLYTFIENSISNLYETYHYDKYLIDKYQLCRRIVDGTITAVKIKNYETATPREILSQMKAVSNLMTFKSPNYNPAGVRRATPLRKQYLLIDATREAINSTEIFATSYFLDEAQAKTNMALIDTFAETDTARLSEILGNGFTPFTEDEKEALSKIVGLAFADDLFMDYYYGLDNAEDGKKQTEFLNPTTLDRNIFLHVWGVVSTSPFAQACVFVTEDIGVESVEITPSEISVSAGIPVQLKAVVETTGFANKSVVWSVTKATGEVTPVTVDNKGLVTIPADFDTSEAEEGQIEITATSVFDNTVSGTASITVL